MCRREGDSLSGTRRRVLRNITFGIIITINANKGGQPVEIGRGTRSAIIARGNTVSRNARNQEIFPQASSNRAVPARVGKK